MTPILSKQGKVGVTLCLPFVRAMLAKCHKMPAIFAQYFIAQGQDSETIFLHTAGH
jgi:hypothetical protein